MRLRTLAFIALLVVGRFAYADTYPRQPGVDAQHYVFRLTLADDTDEIVGEATVTVRLTRDAVTEVFLDLASAAAGKGMTVSEVTSAGQPVTFVHENGRLRLTLASPSKVGDDVTFLVKYRGVPAAGLRIGPNKYKERTFFSSNWPDKARGWLPMIDHPSDKATGEFIVTSPAHYQVVANGLCVEETDLPGDLRRTHWRQSVPIASWLFNIGVARFTVHRPRPVDGVPMETWVFPQDRDVGLPAFEGPARQAIEFFSEHIAPYPYEKVGSVEAAGVNGGMEHASAVFYGEGSVTGRSVVSLVVHELAHSWFGDGVTERDWDDVWLSEGFATYLTLLFTEHVEGRDAFVAGLRQARETVMATEKKLPDAPIVHRNLADMRQVLSSLQYQKGAWVLHMLRGLVGTEAFWTGIRSYYARYHDANASTDDFRRVMEEVSGTPLSAFFTQWLTRPGEPAFQGTWRYDAAARQVEVELMQTQAAEPFRLPLEIGLSFGGAARMRIEKVEVTGRQHRFTFAADAEPTAVVLDPNLWALMQPPVFTKGGAGPNTLHGSGRYFRNEEPGHGLALRAAK
jgi:aminopeptidase N